MKNCNPAKRRMNTFYSWHEWHFHPFYTVKWRTWFNEWNTWQKITNTFFFLPSPALFVPSSTKNETERKRQEQAKSIVVEKFSWESIVCFRWNDASRKNCLLVQLVHSLLVSLTFDYDDKRISATKGKEFFQMKKKGEKRVSLKWMNRWSNEAAVVKSCGILRYFSKLILKCAKMCQSLTSLTPIIIAVDTSFKHT